MRVHHLLFLLLYICPVLCCAQWQDRNEYDEGSMLKQTRQALMSYDIVHKKTNYWENRLESMILNEYTEKILYIAPLVSGKVEFNALDMNFYIDARREKSGVRYTHRF